MPEMDQEDPIGGLLKTALQDVENADNLDQLDRAKGKHLGKNSALAEILHSLGTVSKDKRAALGSGANKAKIKIQEVIKQRRLLLQAPPKESVDKTLPGRKVPVGGLHPLTQVMQEAKAIFGAMGFSTVDGPEIEDPFHNFEALNTPEDHPARDLQDTFFIDKDQLLRTHTSPVQIRVMKGQKPPIRMIAMGRCYRRDATDATHLPVFHQVEGLAVDKDISFADLKGVLGEFTRQFFGPETRCRYRSSFFPFVEPGAELDVTCRGCKGSGCRICKQTGWLELGGLGLVHPAVFRAVGYDPESVSGFAFGFGIERLAMLRWGISDIRLFIENDLRFLEQFR